MLIPKCAITLAAYLREWLNGILNAQLRHDLRDFSQQFSSAVAPSYCINDQSMHCVTGTYKSVKN